MKREPKWCVALYAAGLTPVEIAHVIKTTEQDVTNFLRYAGFEDSNGTLARPQELPEEWKQRLLGR